MLLASIIIPVLNEAKIIEKNLVRLRQVLPDDSEIIIVDGGSSDNTQALALPLVDHLLVSEKPGRAAQMNKGASLARGKVLLFLHIDTILTPEAASQWLKFNDEAWGFFKIALSSDEFMFKVISRCINIRSRLSSVATGDQCLFVNKVLFEEHGGFAPIPLMEDVELCKRLRVLQKPTMIHYPVITSSRRWKQKGIWRTIFLMWRLRFSYFLGKHPDQLVKQYY